MHRDGRIKLAFVLPAVLWVLCFTVFPLVYGVRLSLYDVKIRNPYELDERALRDAAGLIVKLRETKDPLSRYLRGKLSLETRQRVDAYAGGHAPPKPLRRDLVGDLNRLLRGKSLYDPQRFAHVALADDTRGLIGQAQSRDDRVRLNRRLLEEAYPSEVAKTRIRDEFVGLRNYRRFFGDRRALSSAKVTLIFVAVGVPVQMALGMALALLFHRPLPLRGVLRTALTMPLFATPIAVGLLFITVFYEEGGLVNGLLGLKVRWLSHSGWALVSVILVDVWQWTPFCFLVFLAALQGVPEDYYEAARLETNSRWRVFRHITFPVLQPTIVLVLLLRITEAFKVFDIPHTLTNGGPGDATKVLTMYAYEAQRRFRDYGYAAAISVLLFVLVLVTIMTLFKRIRQIHQ